MIDLSPGVNSFNKKIGFLRDIILSMIIDKIADRSFDLKVLWIINLIVIILYVVFGIPLSKAVG